MTIVLISILRINNPLLIVVITVHSRGGEEESPMVKDREGEGKGDGGTFRRWQRRQRRRKLQMTTIATEKAATYPSTEEGVAHEKSNDEG